MKRFPQAKSKRWLLWFAAYGLLVSVLLWICRFVVLQQPFDARIAFRFALLAFALSLIVNVFGWFGASWIWIATTLGAFIGVIVMYAYAARDMNGWEDLAGFLVFIESIVLGFALGVVIEIIYWILGKVRRHP